MQGGVLYCVIVGGAFLAAGLFAVGTIFILYVMDKWKKKDDPGAPGFLEMTRRDDVGQKDDVHHRGTENTEDAQR